MKKEPEISSLIDKAVFDYKLIEENDRICQFRIQEKMPEVTFQPCSLNISQTGKNVHKITLK